MTPSSAARSTRSLALITGASAGIGREIARELAQRGFDLVLTARRREQLDELARELEAARGVKVHVITGDLSNADAPDALVNELAARGLAIDLLINNAGFGDSSPFADADIRKLMDMVQVNVGALTHLTRLLLPGMIARKSGRILNVASTAAYLPGPMMAVYYASKAYVESLSLALAHELKGTGVTVTALCPGPTATEFSSVARAGKAKLFQHTKSMSASEVARQGVEGMFRGRPTVIPGLANKLGVFVGRLLPRTTMASIAAGLNRTS